MGAAAGFAGACLQPALALGPGLVRGSLRGFSITNYPLFCQRAGVDPLTETVGPEVLAAAISVSYATIMVCRLVSLIQRRTIQGFFARYQFSKRTFWLAIGVAVAIMGLILSVPFVSAPHSRDEVCRDRQGQTSQGQNVAVAKRPHGGRRNFRRDACDPPRLGVSPANAIGVLVLMGASHPHPAAGAGFV